ncbi:DUF7697 family protein [Sphingomonas sp. OTU376]
MGQPFALDFGAVISVGSALGADLELLVEVLPDAERSILAALSDDADAE